MVGRSDSRIYEEVKDAHESLLSRHETGRVLLPSIAVPRRRPLPLPHRLGNRIFRVARLEKPPSYLQDPCATGGPPRATRPAAIIEEYCPARLTNGTRL